MNSELIANSGSPDASRSDQQPCIPRVEDPRGSLLQSVVGLVHANGIPCCILVGGQTTSAASFDLRGEGKEHRVAGAREGNPE
jgi:hypothetical protein